MDIIVKVSKKVKNFARANTALSIFYQQSSIFQNACVHFVAAIISKLSPHNVRRFQQGKQQHLFYVHFILPQHDIKVYRHSQYWLAPPLPLCALSAAGLLYLR